MPKDNIAHSNCQQPLDNCSGDRLDRIPEGTFGFREMISQGSPRASAYSSVRLCKDPLFSFLSPVSLCKTPFPLYDLYFGHEYFKGHKTSV